MDTLQTSKWLVVAAQQLLVDEALADAPEGFLKTLQTLQTPQQKKAFISKALEKLGAGSSRVVFAYDGDHVLKVAKDVRGIAQNSVERDVSNMYGRIVSEVVESDESDDPIWLLSERARKALTSDWKNLVGVSWKVAQSFIFNEGLRHQNKPYAKQPDELHDHEFLGSVVSMLADFDMPAGDLARANSWGVVRRGGSDKLVLIDAGLTNDVFKTHYAR